MILGKLTWAAIPLDQPIPLIASLVVVALAILGVHSPGWCVKGHWLPYLWKRMDYLRRSQADRRDVLRCWRW